MIEIAGSDYRISYDPSTHCVTFRGILRLYGTNGYVSLNEFHRSHVSSSLQKSSGSQGGYSSIMKLLDDVIEQASDAIVLDLRELQFLNSSGINVLSKFVIMIRNDKSIALTIRGNHKLSWQKHVLKNLKVLMPDLNLELD